MSVEIVLLLSLVVSGLSVLFWTVRNGISPMPTAPKVTKKLLEALPPLENKCIVDLGSGWGTLAYRLARKYPSCKVVGFENSPLPYLFSRLRSLPNLSFTYGDFFKADLKEADLIVCYLCPPIMKQLRDRFEHDLKPGAVVVSHTFAIPGWNADTVVFVDDLYHTPIYSYTNCNDGGNHECDRASSVRTRCLFEKI